MEQSHHRRRINSHFLLPFEGEGEGRQDGWKKKEKANNVLTTPLYSSFSIERQQRGEKKNFNGVPCFASHKPPWDRQGEGGGERGREGGVMGVGGSRRGGERERERTAKRRWLITVLSSWWVSSDPLLITLPFDIIIFIFILVPVHSLLPTTATLLASVSLSQPGVRSYSVPACVSFCTDNRADYYRTHRPTSGCAHFALCAQGLLTAVVFHSFWKNLFQFFGSCFMSPSTAVILAPLKRRVQAAGKQLALVSIGGQRGLPSSLLAFIHRDTKTDIHRKGLLLSWRSIPDMLR